MYALGSSLLLLFTKRPDLSCWWCCCYCCCCVITPRNTQVWNTRHRSQQGRMIWTYFGPVEVFKFWILVDKAHPTAPHSHSLQPTPHIKQRYRKNDTSTSMAVVCTCFLYYTLYKCISFCSALFMHCTSVPSSVHILNCSVIYYWYSSIYWHTWYQGISLCRKYCAYRRTAHYCCCCQRIWVRIGT